MVAVVPDDAASPQPNVDKSAFTPLQPPAPQPLPPTDVSRPTLI